MTLHREFVLDTSQRWKAAQSFVESNREAMSKANNPLRLIITTQEAKRNAEQNKFYWKAVITQIAEQVWIEGKQYSKEAWHEMAARKFGVCKDVELPNGEVVIKRLSTSEMKVKEFAQYIEEVSAWAASELSVVFYVQEEKYSDPQKERAWQHQNSVFAATLPRY